MRQSESIAQLAPAFVAAQAAIEAAKKDSDNPFFKSKYADLAEVWRVVKEAFAPQGLSIMQFPEIAEDGSVTLTTRLLHTSGEWVDATMPVRLAKDDPQGVGSGITYARRYALGSLCGVVTEDDDDGEAAMGRGAQAGKTQRVKPAVPKPVTPRSIGDEGRQRLVALCVDGEKQGASKSELSDIIREYAKGNTDSGKIADLTPDQETDVRAIVASVIKLAAQAETDAAKEAA